MHNTYRESNQWLRMSSNLGKSLELSGQMLNICYLEYKLSKRIGQLGLGSILARIL
jgi:hypothetical protein